MVSIVFSDDATLNKLNQEDLIDIAKLICEKNKLVSIVNIFYRADEGNKTIHENLLHYENSSACDCTNYRP